MIHVRFAILIKNSGKPLEVLVAGPSPPCPSGTSRAWADMAPLWQQVLDS
jgi:hypothetical protein